MNHSIIQPLFIAAALLLSGGLALAAETKPGAPAGEPKAAATDARKAQPKAKPVDINSASKAQLKKLPAIGDAEAEKIIAGRPYLSKAHLVTRNVLPHGVYVQISDKIIAVQKPEYMKQKSEPAKAK